MIRLYVVTEGKTEQLFIKNLLQPHLWQLGIHASGVSLTTSKTSRGGLVRFAQAEHQMRLQLGRPDASRRVSTMFDYYSLPTDFPGYEVARRASSALSAVQQLEQSLAKRINDRRFVPYLQLHEFEALLLSAPDHFLCLENATDEEVEALTETVHRAGGAELVDDGPETAPSKLIRSHFPSFKKTTDGVQLAKAIGLPAIRAACPHFDDWLKRLESLAGG